MNYENNRNNTETKEICDILNKCFVSSGNLFLNVNLLNSVEPNIIEFRPRQPQTNYFSFNLTNNIEIYNTINKLKENTTLHLDKTM